MSRRLHAALCAAAFVVCFAVSSVVTGFVHDAVSPDLPPCPTEDSPGCYWDASSSGNGRGVDVVNP